MKLNEKVLVFLLLFFILIISIALIVGSSFYLETYEKLDERETLSNIQDAVHALNTSRTNDLRILRDWAIWDDTYDYISNPYHPPAFIEHNLLPETFRQLEIDFFVLSERNGTIVWGRTYNEADNALRPLPMELLASVNAVNHEMSGARAGETESGIVIVDNSPFIIGTAPVIHSDGSGPPVGRLTLGSSIRDSLISRIAAVSSPSVTILPAGDLRIPEAIRLRLEAAAPLSPVVTVRDEDTVTGYVQLDDFFAAPALVITIGEQRTFFHQGLSSLISGIFIFLGISALLGSLTLIMVDRIVLRRLGLLRDAADEIRTSGTLSGEVDVGGNDELSDVATAFNQMIRTIGENQQELAMNREYLDRIFTSVKAGIIVIDATTHAIIDINPAGAAMLKEAKEMIIGRTCHTYFREAGPESSRAATTGSGDNPGQVLLRADGTELSVIRNAARLHIRGRDCLLEMFIDNTGRRQMEQALRESEEKFRNLVETSPNILWEIGTDGTFRYISPMVTMILGFNPEEIIGRTLKDVVPEEEQEAALHRLAWAFSAKGPLPSIEIPARHRNGDPLVLEIRPTRLTGPDGRVIGLRGVAVDITNRRRAEGAVRESEERFRGMAERSSDLIFILNKEMSPTYVSPSARTIIGYDPAELVGKPPEFAMATIFQKSGPGFMKGIQENLDGRSIENFEILLTKKDGRTVYVSAYAVPVLQDGVFSGAQVSMRDITAKKNAEKALRESEEKFRNLAENTADVLFTLDRTGQITYISPQVSQYGYVPDELMGRSFLTLIHPEDAEKISRNFSTEMTTGKQVAAAFRIIDRKGSIFWIEERSNILFDDEGNARGMQGVIRDITDRKKAEDAIRLANRKLNLLNDITRHDIVNTLTGLLGTIEMARDPAMADDRDLLLADIRTLGMNIQKQIEFTREYQAVGVKEPVWQNVLQIIQKAANQSEGSGVAIFNDITPFEVFADPLLEKVFYNLIQNALRYGKNLHAIRFTEGISDRGFAIVCEDDGGGIPPGIKEKIFGRGIGQNTGMGLFLSREILGITGITIRENGIYGKGARFEMVIPKGGYRFV